LKGLFAQFLMRQSFENAATLAVILSQIFSFFSQHTTSSRRYMVLHEPNLRQKSR